MQLACCSHVTISFATTCFMHVDSPLYEMKFSKDNGTTTTILLWKWNRSVHCKKRHCTDASWTQQRVVVAVLITSVVCDGRYLGVSSVATLAALHYPDCWTTSVGLVCNANVRFLLSLASVIARNARITNTITCGQLIHCLMRPVE